MRIAREFLFVGHRSLMGWSRDFAMQPPMLAKLSAPGYVYILLPFRYVRSMGGSVHAGPVLFEYALVRTGGTP